MYTLYIDESGDSQTVLSKKHDAQPLFCLGGIIVNSLKLRAFTHDIIKFKKQFHPGLLPKDSLELSWLQKEIKGNDLRRDIRRWESRQKIRQVRKWYKKLFAILEKYEVKFLARVYVKKISTEINLNNVYSSAIQCLFNGFENFLAEKNSYGISILDARTYEADRAVGFSLATCKFKQKEDQFPRIIECPVFAPSNTHVGLQVCDWLLSGLLFPVCAITYAQDYVSNIHTHPNFMYLKINFATYLERLQYRYFSSSEWKGGITISDPVGHKSGASLFKDKEGNLLK